MIAYSTPALQQKGIDDFGKISCGSPTTCSAQGAQCGSMSDRCGGTLNCGTCPQGQICNENRCAAPVPAVPEPMTAGLGAIMAMFGLAAVRSQRKSRQSR